MPTGLTESRFAEVTNRYSRLRVAVIGDFCLDRYLEIDPTREETSIETGLPVHNVVRVRSQPGGAGTILNNLVALGVGRVFPVGFAGVDGEGYELERALKSLPGVDLRGFVRTTDRHTFTYCKPLVVAAGSPPRELNRLDTKNWSPTPEPVQEELRGWVAELAREVDAMILLDQVDLEGTGVVTPAILEEVRRAAQIQPKLWMIADSRRGLEGFPPVCWKMNAAELARLVPTASTSTLPKIQECARGLATRQRVPIFVTLSERGIVGATPDGEVEYVPCLPVRGEIDVVGAGDAVTANLAAALAARASLREALVLANAAASVVVHQLGTTGSASVQDLRAHVVSGA